MTTSTQTAPATRTVRSLRYHRVDWERLNLSVLHYVKKRPLKMRWGTITRPTPEELAIAYDVSVADIHRRLDEQ
jgi:hypothetical protein